MSVLSVVPFCSSRSTARRYRMARTAGAASASADKAAGGYALRAMGYWLLTILNLGFAQTAQTFRLENTWWTALVKRCALPPGRALDRCRRMLHLHRAHDPARRRDRRRALADDTATGPALNGYPWGWSTAGGEASPSGSGTCLPAQNTTLGDGRLRRPAQQVI
ncbi:hypothetical protein [Antarctobacter sp.]|uniref:hypothetical protein n=1 Tax=Antarctobacter sp. TaxID=1872577 RepID=UPI003A95C9C7